MSIINDTLMAKKIRGDEDLLVAGREMDRACAIGRGLPSQGLGAPRRALESGAGRRVALLLLVSLGVLSPAVAVAAEPEGASGQSGEVYILNLEQLQPLNTADIAVPENWPGFSAVSSPTGVFLPDASAYFNLDAGQGEFTYLTPRVQGVQVSWTGDRSADARSNYSDAAGTHAYVTRPTSVGASFARGADDFEVSLGGDYGRSSKSVPGAVRLVNDQKLLRVGAHARIREFTLGGAFGSDVDPGKLGETLSWDAFGRYDFGALAVGLVYNYTVESDSSSGQGSGVPGTLQGGVSYFFTPRMAVTTNLAYGSYVDQSGSDDSGIAAVLGFSLDF